jgi:hypothetical protein
MGEARVVPRKLGAKRAYAKPLLFTSEQIWMLFFDGTKRLD